ncbi:MAG: translation initiation factor [Bacteroidota bacterium]
MSKKKRKNISGIVYSTDPDFEYNYDNEEEADTPGPAEQKLVISLDTKKRKGKTVTLVSGFTGKQEDLADLGKQLKTHCGTGGSAKDGEIIIQGDSREKVRDFLLKKGYKKTKIR